MLKATARYLTEPDLSQALNLAAANDYVANKADYEKRATASASK